MSGDIFIGLVGIALIVMASLAMRSASHVLEIKSKWLDRHPEEFVRLERTYRGIAWVGFTLGVVVILFSAFSLIQGAATFSF